MLLRQVGMIMAKHDDNRASHTELRQYTPQPPKNPKNSQQKVYDDGLPYAKRVALLQDAINETSSDYLSIEELLRYVKEILATVKKVDRVTQKNIDRALKRVEELITLRMRLVEPSLVPETCEQIDKIIAMIFRDSRIEKPEIVNYYVLIDRAAQQSIRTALQYSLGKQPPDATTFMEMPVGSGRPSHRP